MNIALIGQTYQNTQSGGLGGVCDTDCCIRICDINGIMIRIGKGERSWPYLDFLQAKLGGIVYNNDHEPNGRTPMKEWCLRGQAARDFCMEMQYFTFAKRLQMEKALEFLFRGFHITQLVPVLGSSPDGQTKCFASGKHCAREVGEGDQNVRRSCRTGRPTKSGWKFVELKNPNYS